MNLSRIAYCAVALSVLDATAHAQPGAATTDKPAGPVAAVEDAITPPAGTPAEASAVAAPEPLPQPPAAVAPPTPPPITLVAKVDLATQRLTVVVHGKSTYTWPISSGAQGYATPGGTFKPGWMAKMWYSKQYDDAPMPHAVFFKDGAAIHATTSIHALGRPASHGCVRLSPANAETFYKLVSKHSLVQTRVHVYGTPKFAPPVMAYRAPPRPGYQSVTYVNAYQPYPGGHAGYDNGGSWFGGGNSFGGGYGQSPSALGQPVRQRVRMNATAPSAKIRAAAPQARPIPPRMIRVSANAGAVRVR